MSVIMLADKFQEFILALSFFFGGGGEFIENIFLFLAVLELAIF